jgi:hypothetical protein
VRQGDNLSPTLFNIYINELEGALKQSAVPGLTVLESEVKCLLFADDLVLLSPTKEGLLQHLDILQIFCNTWALTVNLSKTKKGPVTRTMNTNVMLVFLLFCGGVVGRIGGPMHSLVRVHDDL